MKKTLLSIAGAGLLAIAVFVYVNNEKKNLNAIINANVEALADQKPTSFGICTGNDYGCMIPCPHCGALLYGLGRNYGIVTSLHGICPACNEEISI
ncbi:MAG: hypothetical protein HUJ92_08155 [Bacteroidales bacterium]|nr:hypothetical protein [Bacteroidales bacterium]